MIRKRGARALIGALLLVLLLTSGGVALAVVTGKLSGRTSQKQPISFRLAHGDITRLEFHINDRCPSGNIWNADDHGFGRLRINKFHKFGNRFSDTSSARPATAEIKGTVFRHKVVGSLFDRRFIPKEHHYCSGRATFSLHRP
jgi:hypothetical protein